MNAPFNPQKVALVFPGQGSQSIGMAEEICRGSNEAMNTFSTVAKLCDFDLIRLAWTGPDEALRRTRHAQPALLAASAACMQALRQHWTEDPLCVAGHSLGEISALWAAEVLRLDEAAQLVVLRGELMDTAPAGEMAAVIGLTGEEVTKVCLEAGCSVANLNSPQQTVISGDTASVRAATRLLGERKARVIPLAVSGAFHSPLMLQASFDFKVALEELEFADAVCPVIQNIDAKPCQDAVSLKAKLAEQMVSPVRWVETVEQMLALGAEAFIEIGSGTVLSGLIKKCDRSLRVYNTDSKQALDEVLGALCLTKSC